MNLPDILTEEQFSPDTLAGQAMDSPAILHELLALIYSRKERIRFNSYETLRVISEQKPEILYPEWNKLTDLLLHKNNYLKFIGINLVANLVLVDKEKRFNQAFDSFFGILRESVTIAPIYVVMNAWKIATARPDLEPEITRLLLSLDRIHPGKQIALIRGAAIETFEKYYHLTGFKQEILDFIRAQLDNPSPKARKLAKDFLNRRGIT